MNETDKPLNPPTCNPRIAAFTDDLTPSQMQSLLSYLYVNDSQRRFIASIKKWRKLNGMPVDPAD